MATTRNSTLYANIHVNKYISDARDIRGRVHPIPFEHTVVTGETGGASAGVQDLVNLCVLPANCKVVSFDLAHEALGVSAGAGVLLDIGDAVDPDRYLAGKDVDAAGQTNGLVFSGQNYEPTADTIVQARWRVADPVVGRILRGCFYVIPAV